MLTRTRLSTETLPLTKAETIRDAWIALSRHAIEPNPYFEIDHLAAIAREMTPDETHHLVLVRAASETPGGRLAGLFPVSVRGFRKGYPGRVTSLSFDSMIGFSVPLIADPEPEGVWAAFLDHVADSDDFANVVHLPEFYADGPCGAALGKAAANGRARIAVERAFERAVACPGSDYATYAGRWSKKKARNIRSRGRKLAELGQIAFAITTQDDPAYDATLAEILALEAEGWKGREGTALASREATRRFADSAYRSADRAPEMHLATLRLDGRLIAGDINLVAQNRAYFIKSAYDEAHSALGPGVLLYAWQLEEMLDRGRYARLDSCADAGHSLEEIWLERETVQSVFVAAAAAVSAPELDRVLAWRRRIAALKTVLREGLGAARKAAGRGGG